MRRRELLASLPLAATAGCTIGGDPPAPDGFRLASPAIEGDDLPPRYTCDGEGESLPLRLEGVPEPAVSIAIVGEWLRGHSPQTIWLLWGISAEPSIEIPAGLPSDGRISSPIDAVQGSNDEGSVGYRPPCHETPDHQEYRFIAHALPDRLSIDPGADRDTFESAIESVGSPEASTTLDVRYERFSE